MERFSFIFLTAGLGFFILAFVVSGWIPMLPVKDLEVMTLEQLAANPPMAFIELREQYAEPFEKAFGNVSNEVAFADALKTGHKIYVGEACWHCHSQQIRPWSNDEARFGRKAYPEEFHNVLNMPPLWGTRRIGPDLSRQNDVHSNDWHVAHFWNPTDVVPWSVMPPYPWFYEDDGVTPNKKGLSIIAYVQWLGSMHRTIPEDVHEMDRITRESPAPRLMTPASPTSPATAGQTPTPGSPGSTPAPAAEEDDGYGY